MNDFTKGILVCPYCGVPDNLWDDPKSFEGAIVNSTELVYTDCEQCGKIYVAELTIMVENRKLFPSEQVPE